MRFYGKASVLLFLALLTSVTASASKIVARPSSTYGLGGFLNDSNPHGGPLFFEQTESFTVGGVGFTENLVCSTTSLVDPPCSDVSGLQDGSIFTLVLGISSVGAGATGPFSVSFPGFTSQLDFGQLICGTFDTGQAVVPANDVACMNAPNAGCDAALDSLFSSNGSFQIPAACLIPGEALFFDNTSTSNPGFASVSSGTTATPESSPLLLLAISLPLLGLVSKRCFRF